jgi:hypothetical protein
MTQVADNATRATMAYRGAVEDYGNFIDTTMRQYGWSMPGADGNYSVRNAQNAFDPDQVIQFDSSGKPVFDQEAVLARTRGGQYGTQGLFAQTAQAGAAREAEARLGARSRGLAGGGLMTQQERLAETMAGEEMGQASATFLSDVMGKYMGLGKRYEDVAVAEAEDARINAAIQAGLVPLEGDLPAPVEEPAPVAEPTMPAADTRIVPPGKNVVGEILPQASRGNYKVKGNPQGSNRPKNPEPGRVFKGSGGTAWVYRKPGPAGNGWYKKG